MSQSLGLLARTRLAWNVMRGGSPKLGRKDPPYVFPVFNAATASWEMYNFKTYVNEGYNLNSIIRMAIDYKVRAISSAMLRAYTGDPDQPERLPRNSPLNKLLLRPNLHQSGMEFSQLNTVYLNLAGNVYIYLDRKGRSKGLPDALWSLRPDRVKIVPGENSIKGYMYQPDGVSPRGQMPILPEDLIHIKLPNPGDEYEGMGYGLSPISAMAQSGDVDNSITKFLKLLFDNKTMLGGVLKFNVPMQDEEVSRARRRWQEVYGGVENWGEVAVLDSGGTYEPFTPDFDKLNFKNVDSRNEKRIVGPFGVPGMLIGLQMDNSTFSNFEQADRVFWQNTFLPELRLYEAEFEYYLSEGDAFPKYDVSGVPALQKNIPALVDAAHKMWTMGTPRAVAYGVVGLNVPESAGDQASYIPRSIVPVNEDGTPIMPPPATSSSRAQAGLQPQVIVHPPILSPPAKKSKWSTEEKAVIWKAVDDIAVSHEAAFGDGARERFEADKRAALALAGEMQEKARARKATINWLEMLDDVKAYLDGQGAEGWRTTFVPLIEGVVEDAGDYWSAQTGLAFNVRNLLAESWLADYTLVLAQPINQTTSDPIQKVLAQGQAEGWSIQTMQKNMETLFKQWMDGDLTDEDFKWFSDRMPPHRTELIARTETTHATNAGSYNLFKAWEVGEKEWLATQDNRTRDSHANANGQVVSIDEPFAVGGFKMMHPGDTSLGAPVSEIADCRCALLPVMPDDDA